MLFVLRMFYVLFTVGLACICVDNARYYGGEMVWIGAITAVVYTAFSWLMWPFIWGGHL